MQNLHKCAKATNIGKEASAEVNLDLQFPSQPNKHARDWIWNSIHLWQR